MPLESCKKKMKYWMLVRYIQFVENNLDFINSKVDTLIISLSQC